MLDSAVRHSVRHPSTQTPRKLRDSCTDCASSKVKCSKEKPTCARCARRGVTCIYMVSRRTGRTSSNASKGDPGRIWIGASGLSVSVSAGSARPRPGATVHRSMSGSSGSSASSSGHQAASGSTNAVLSHNGHASITANGLANSTSSNGLNGGGGGINNGSNGNAHHGAGTTNSTTSTTTHESSRAHRPSLRVGTPMLSHSTITVSPGHVLGQQTPDLGSAPGADTDLWSSLLSPSALMADPAELSPPLTTIGTDVGDLFDLGLHSPMMIDCPEQQRDPPAPDSDHNHHHHHHHHHHHGQPATPDLFDGMGLSVSDPDFSASADPSAFDWVLPSAASTTTASPPPPPTTAATAALPPPPPPPKPPHCCFTTALDILSRLFPGSPTCCTLPSSPHHLTHGPLPKARTLDSVISDNKQILESLTAVLDCPCSQDEYLLSLTTLIALKVMGWYAAAAADTPPVSPASPPPAVPAANPWSTASRPGTGSTSSSSSGGASPTPSPVVAGGGTAGMAEQVLRLPATVGNYCVAGQHQGRMAAQLVLSELHRVQRIVNVLSERLEGVRVRAGEQQGGLQVGGGGGKGGVGGDGAGVVGGRVPPFSGQTFGLLEQDLRKRLRVLSSETIDVLRRA